MSDQKTTDNSLGTDQCPDCRQSTAGRCGAHIAMSSTFLNADVIDMRDATIAFQAQRIQTLEQELNAEMEARKANGPWRGGELGRK